MQEDLSKIFLKGMANSFKFLVTTSLYAAIWRGITVDITDNKDQPFRLDYRPSKNCPVGSIRKKTCRQVLPKIQLLLKSDLQEKIMIFLDLIEYIKPMVFKGISTQAKEDIANNLINLANSEGIDAFKIRYLHRQLNDRD